MKQRKNVDTAKASQESDIPTKILTANYEFFAQYFCENINYCIFHSTLPSNLKSADVTPVCKTNSKNSKENHRPISILSNFDVHMIKCRTILKIYCQNINVAFAKATMPNIAL